MKCANPNCNQHLLYLRGGTLRLLELECSPEGRISGESGGFPVACASSRCFWLCAACSKILTLRRWTDEGLVLEPRIPAADGGEDVPFAKPPAAVGPASILYYHGGRSESA